MESKIESQDDGSVQLLATFTEEELQSLVTQFHALSDEDPTASFGGGNDYCITRTKPGSDFGKKTTVHAGNKFFAFLMGVRLYGSDFSITDGRCH